MLITIFIPDKVNNLLKQWLLLMQRDCLFLRHAKKTNLLRFLKVIPNLNYLTITETAGSALVERNGCEQPAYWRLLEDDYET
ncbi:MULTISPECIES: hypothetical protein [Atlantibacter]|uniref:hypothetical protein n=1 Tax=Atlantibacter TaxID=1903434 RepID=UPI000EEECB87|nr:MULTISPECIES: hypothetical protein [Atlantibacter]MCQ4966894.1 hypothetical protein [Enterobacteriaceae bacterium DFI.7.85]HAI51276.1 hypothetical protein [Enterobacteriaceae bacterium]MBW9431911.1 hypothetical protein [Atlantibacter hermannii]MDQ7883267.1 hypothetical protein [Atlantibacter hermannii]MDU7389654.1 hypothetical protein [Atlantibacter hermannii]